MLELLCLLFIAMFVAPIFLSGFFTLEPGIEAVHLSFGNYVQTITEPGIHFVQTIGRTLRKVSVRQVTHDIPISTVVEATGNPVLVSAVLRYQVIEAEKAVLNVDNHAQFVADQASAILKRVVSRYPYESPDPEVACLRKETGEIGVALKHELQKVVKVAGVKVISVKLNDLTYAPEIAQAMLIRQQAIALIDARKAIVEGAVEMVRDAAEQLEACGFRLPSSEQNRLVANLMVVLCSSQDTQPVVPISPARDYS